MNVRSPRETMIAASMRDELVRRFPTSCPAAGRSCTRFELGIPEPSISNPRCKTRLSTFQGKSPLSLLGATGSKRVLMSILRCFQQYCSEVSELSSFRSRPVPLKHNNPQTTNHKHLIIPMLKASVKERVASTIAHTHYTLTLFRQFKSAFTKKEQNRIPIWGAPTVPQPPGPTLTLNPRMLCAVFCMSLCCAVRMLPV